MAFRIEFAADAARDLDLIVDHLVDSYVGFGEPVDEAFRRAAQRVRAIRRPADPLPHRGARHDALRAGLRHGTMGGAVYWFKIDEDAAVVRVLAIFFGGQDHIRRMLIRLLDAPDP